MRAEAFGDANGPLAADRRSGGRILGEDVARCGAGGIEAVLEGEAKPEGAGLFAGFGESEAGEVGNFDLAAVDSETDVASAAGTCTVTCEVWKIS